MATTSISWFDLDPDDLRRAREFILGTQTEGVIDELGFGVLTSAIADHLYPATTTIQTRVRYMFFVPAIYLWLERQGTRSANVANEARRAQDELRKLLSRKSTLHVIGAEAGIDVVRLPSNIYWNGLRQLGIFTQPISEGAYHDKFDELRAGSRYKDDDDAVHPGTTLVPYWDPAAPIHGLLDREGRFQDSTTFALERAEAEDLLRRFKTLHPESLMLHLIETTPEELAWPWDAPRASGALALLLRHARSLSTAARGATLMYHHMLVERRDELSIAKDSADTRAAFERWWSVAKPELRKWHPGEALAIPAIQRGVRLGDPLFLERWNSLVTESSSAYACLTNLKARELIRRRELDKRPYKARLKFTRHLKQWSPPQAYPAGDEHLYALEYRHPIGQRFVNEIRTGLGRS